MPNARKTRKAQAAKRKKRRQRRIYRTILTLLIIGSAAALCLSITPIRETVAAFWPFAGLDSADSELSENNALTDSAYTAPIPSEVQTPTLPEKPGAPEAGELLENNYIFQQLNEEQKAAVRTIKNGMMACEEEIRFSTPISLENASAAMQVLNDQDVELIHFEGSSGWTFEIDSQGSVAAIQLGYTMAPEELQANLQALYAKADELAAQTSGLTPYQKTVFFNDVLVDQTEYDLDAANAHNAYGALIENRAVCDGYTQAMNLLLARSVISSISMHGFASASSAGHSSKDLADLQPEYDEEGAVKVPEYMVGHAWNAIRLDDGWYYADVTFDDPNGEDGFGKHRYLNLSFDDLRHSHVFAPWQPLAPLYPVENNTTYSWYVQENRQADSEEQAKEIFLQQLEQKEPSVVIRITDPQAFQRISDDRQIIASLWADNASNVGWDHGLVSVDELLQVIEFSLPYLE